MSTPQMQNSNKKLNNEAAPQKGASDNKRSNNFGVVLIIVGSLTLLVFVLLLFRIRIGDLPLVNGTDNSQFLALVAFISCLFWLFAYGSYRQEPNFVREISIAMAIVTGLAFGVLVLVWFNLALLFLVVAPFILYFPFSYMAYTAFQRPVRIKRLRTDFELLTAQWDEALYQQSTSVFNYLLHITLVVLVTLLGVFILFMPLSDLMALSEIGKIGFEPLVVRAMGFGFLGSLLYSIYYIYRRYTTSDLLPSAYLYCAITIVLGIVFNYVSFRALAGISANPGDSPEGLVLGMGDLLSFAIGFFPILAVQWLTRTVYKALGQRQRRSDLFPLDQLDGISHAQEARLRDFGIDDAQNLASTEMPLLLINTPFPVQTVVDWVDQAILMVLLNDVNALDSFRKAHVRTMTDFRDLWEPFDEKQCRLKQERDAVDGDEKKVEGVEKKLTKLREAQTDIATALNSNISLLNALYSSTNFDMNIHYLNNYRRNVDLLLPNWQGARYNHYLIEAYQAKNDDPNTERNLVRLWKVVSGYLVVNDEIKKARQDGRDDGSHGTIVKPSSVEARIGLARLYAYCATTSTDEAEKQRYQDLVKTEIDEAGKHHTETSKVITHFGNAAASQPANGATGQPEVSNQSQGHTPEPPTNGGNTEQAAPKIDGVGEDGSKPDEQQNS